MLQYWPGPQKQIDIKSLPSAESLLSLLPVTVLRSLLPGTAHTALLPAHFSSRENCVIASAFKSGKQAERLPQGAPKWLTAGGVWRAPGQAAGGPLPALGAAGPAAHCHAPSLCFCPSPRGQAFTAPALSPYHPLLDSCPLLPIN